MLRITVVAVSSLGVASSLCCAATALAQSVAEPALQAEDTWTYVNTLERSPNIWRQTHNESRVVRISAAGVLISNSQVGSTNPPVELLVTADWGRFRSIGGKETPVSKPLSFPLTVGKTWDLEYTDDHPTMNSHKTETRQYHYRVVGWEDIKVPAGSFHALKIESDGTWSAEVAPKVAATVATEAGADGTRVAAQTVNVTARTVTGRMYDAVWYAPDVKRPVKSESELYDTGGVRTERSVAELESFKLAN